MKKQSYTITGQVGIIVVLVGIVIFTLGMATAARVTTDVQISGRAEEGQKAFYAAEAAMEIALHEDLTVTTNGVWNDNPDPNLRSVNADWNATARPEPDPLNPPNDLPYEVGELALGQVRTIWLLFEPNDPQMSAAYNDSFRIGWATNAADGDEVEISIFYESATASEPVVVARRYVEGPDDEILIDPTTNGITVGGTTAPFDPAFVVATDRMLFARIKPVLGNGITDVVVDDYGDFPDQEFHITAVGQLVNQPVRRRVEGSRFVGGIPLFMDYVVANTSTVNGLEKN